MYHIKLSLLQPETCISAIEPITPLVLRRGINPKPNITFRFRKNFDVLCSTAAIVVVVKVVVKVVAQSRDIRPPQPKHGRDALTTEVAGFRRRAKDESWGCGL